MKQYLLLLLLVLGSFQAFAQEPATAPATPAPTAAPATTSAAMPAAATTTVQSDTVRAMRAMFRQHRVGGAIWSGIGGVFGVRILTAAASLGDASGVVPGLLIFTGIPGGIGIGKLTRFSLAKEEAAVAAYTQRKPLPHYVERRLRKKYFAR